MQRLGCIKGAIAQILRRHQKARCSTRWIADNFPWIWSHQLYHHLYNVAAKTGRKKADIVRLLLDEALTDVDERSQVSCSDSELAENLSGRG